MSAALEVSIPSPMESTPRAAVAGKTEGAIRTFFYQLAERNRDYRSLHSLTQQIEHQYHGRFLIELIQNAHDALLPAGADSEGMRRIEFRICDEGKFGALYVANDGAPFSPSNFNSLAQLGQSDKDPQKSIGNKGIGFRSVLEITHSPAIYSRATRASSEFDGYCFGFSPEILERIGECALAIMQGNDNVPSPVGNGSLMDWDAYQLAKFRKANADCAREDDIAPDDWILRELHLLSPYLLPVPLSINDATQIREFEQRGFATLICFPFKSAVAAELARDTQDSLDTSTLLFLDKASSIVLDSGRYRREVRRRETPHAGSQLEGREVTLESHGRDTQRYWLWSRHITISDAPEAVRVAVQGLPGKWPEIEEATVTVAVRIGEHPEVGKLSIFLPTALESGCGAHINAPFFGDMSRTHIEFNAQKGQSGAAGAAYNRFLLEQAGELVLEVIKTELAGSGINAACAIVDMLAPAHRGQGTSWWPPVAGAAGRTGLDMTMQPWFLSDRGWGALQEMFLLPTMTNATVLTAEALRQNATFAVFVAELNARKDLIELLSSTDGAPPKYKLATTVEAIAQRLHARTDTDWNAFWIEAGQLFDDDCSHLLGKRVLLGNDGKLHASGPGFSAVFFAPRMGLSDDEEVENEGDVKTIPPALSPFFAFLSEQIHVYEEKSGRWVQTAIRKLLLDSKLVSRFRREDILEGVLTSRTPSLPHPLNGPQARLCSDILLWALRLMAQFADGIKAERTLRLLRNLPAPCKGGWYRLGDTAFGSGWDGAYGSITERYLQRVKTTAVEEALKRLLLPPTDQNWQGDGEAHLRLLRTIGVFDGVRLITVEPKQWDSRFHATKHNFRLPYSPPPGWPASNWGPYSVMAAKEAHPQHNKGVYEIQAISVLPGLEKYAEFDNETRASFMEVVLVSAPHWKKGWETLWVHRVEGNSDPMDISSPLLYELRMLKWLGFKDDSGWTWWRPSERWYVPAMEMGRGRKWQFAHLRPLPGEFADRLDRDTDLSAMFRRLDMPKFQPDELGPSTVLLDALADAVERKDIPHRDVFLGQIRAAWRGFKPARSSRFPSRVIVQRGGGEFAVEVPGAEHQTYLPDIVKSFHGVLRHFALPIIAIESHDAGRLAEGFQAAYSGGIVRTSELEPVPLADGVPWDGHADGRLRDDNRLEWLIPALLTLAAYHGPQSHGTTSQAFRECMQTLREARLAFVGKIETRLVQGDKPVAPSMSVPALWVQPARALLLGDGWKDGFAGLSEALASMVRRDDLDVPLKLFLNLTGAEPDEAAIMRALESLKLGGEHFRDVREHWRGDAGKVIEMLTPLLTILKPSASLAPLFELDGDDAIASFLATLGIAGVDRSLITSARQSDGMFSFGRMMTERFGSYVDLVRWNAALAGRNQPQLLNTEARTEFRGHLAACAQPLRSLAACVAARVPEVGSFAELNGQIETMACPTNFTTDHWEVTCQLALSTLLPLFEHWKVVPEELEALRSAFSAEDLLQRLAGVGVQVGFDPLQAARDNREKLRHALELLQQIGLAWALEHEQSNPAEWESRAQTYYETLDSQIGDAVLLEQWDDDDVWRQVQTLAVGAVPTAFWERVLATAGPDQLAAALQLTRDALASASDRLEAMREQAIRRKRLVHVCGGEFDGSEDNLGGLWRHIVDHLPSNAVEQLSALDLRKTIPLDTILPAAPSKREGRQPKKSATAPKYLSKSMESLIGLAGEIHAFRMLQQIYGATAVSPSAWVSGNSAKAYPGKATEDGRGCDFVVPLQDRIYYIEVKATDGDHTVFTLGSSEIRLARELSRKVRKRKERFVILRVSRALSNAPNFELLPNPYDPEYQGLFDVEDADARVTYKRHAQGLNRRHPPGG